MIVVLLGPPRGEDHLVGGVCQGGYERVLDMSINGQIWPEIARNAQMCSDMPRYA